MVDEQQLLERLLADDAQAYQELVNTYQSSMYAVAVAIAGFQNSDDVVQDSWLSIVRNIKNFQGRSSLKTWLLRITANWGLGSNGTKNQRKPYQRFSVSSSQAPISTKQLRMSASWLISVSRSCTLLSSSSSLRYGMVNS